MIGISGAAIGPFPLALLHDLTGTYATGILLMMALPALSLVSIYFTPAVSQTSAPFD